VDCECGDGNDTLAAAVERVLLDPAYAGFLEAAMAIGDGAGRETVNDLGLYETWCLAVAEKIAGRKVEKLNAHFKREEMPAPLAMALNAIFTGVSMGRNQQTAIVPGRYNQTGR